MIMSDENRIAVCAEELNNLVQKNQSYLFFKKIIEAAKNFRRVAYISCDIKIKEDVINYIKELGYKVDISVHTKTSPYMYTYEVRW